MAVHKEYTRQYTNDSIFYHSQDYFTSQISLVSSSSMKL